VNGAVRCVDVVVDVPTTRLDEPFTYVIGGVVPAIGSRVRVPLGGRTVTGWVISEPVGVPEDAALKSIDSVGEDAPRFDAAAVRLAAWLRRRYACTFREALAVVAKRGTGGDGASRVAFVAAPPEGKRIAVALHRRFSDGSFSLLGARRALRASGISIGAAALQKEFAQLARVGVLRRISDRTRTPARRAPATGRVILLDAAAAKGSAQQRLVRILAAAGGELLVPDARKQAGVGADVIRRAVAAGSIQVADRPVALGDARVASVEPFSATGEQRAAIERLDALLVRSKGVALLHGVTGSGKTFVYSRLIDRVRSAGGRAVVLVPEISLTPQTSARFVAAFGSSVGVLHSGLSESERARVWEDAERGSLDVVVGARSAVFAPLPKLALIVVDEEHEPSYKQDVAPRYDAAAVARERMSASGGSVLLGSATPSLETYWEARSGSIGYVRLEQRATAAPLPPVEIVDMSADLSPHGRRPIGTALVGAIEDALSRHEKVMLFVNRRGYAGLLLCRSCGFVPKCRRCAVSLVLHSTDDSLRCHVCGAAFRAPTQCPRCHGQELRPFGFGTQRVEQEARELFGGARIVRMDSDTTGPRGSHGSLLEAFAEGGDILVGTQMIAKGLDFPTVTVVGVVSADIDLHRPDFRAAERTFQLLTQVAGRAGRAAAGSRVIVQTYSPGHYAVELAARHDYDAFAQRELELRRELNYPPFGRLAYFGLAGVDLPEVASAASTLAEMLRADFSAVQTLGPAPDPLPKARGEYRMRIALKASDEARLLEASTAASAIKFSPSVRLTTIIDPR